MSTIKLLSRFFEKYITITAITDKTYTYRREIWPVVVHDLHREKCKRGSWLYIAVNGNSDLNDLHDYQKLYVGSKKNDRMFRGLKNNFHHKQMRKGNGLNNLEEYLKEGETVDIYIISKDVLMNRAANDPKLKYISLILSDNSLNDTDHPGYWYEQTILYEEKQSWSWNTKGADSKAKGTIKKYILKYNN